METPFWKQQMAEEILDSITEDMPQWKQDGLQIEAQSLYIIDEELEEVQSVYEMGTKSNQDMVCC